MLLSGAVAEAAKKPRPRAKVYGAALSSAAGSPHGAVTGKVKLVDNAKRDTASIHLEGLLQPGATYYWVIYKVLGDKPPCAPGSAGPGVESFHYRDLKVNPSGQASATAKSRAFVAFTTTRYAVAVRDAEDQDVACAELTRKKAA